MPRGGSNQSATESNGRLLQCADEANDLTIFILARRPVVSWQFGFVMV